MGKIGARPRPPSTPQFKISLALFSLLRRGDSRSRGAILCRRHSAVRLLFRKAEDPAGPFPGRLGQLPWQGSAGKTTISVAKRSIVLKIPSRSKANHEFARRRPASRGGGRISVFVKAAQELASSPQPSPPLEERVGERRPLANRCQLLRCAPRRFDT